MIFGTALSGVIVATTAFAEMPRYDRKLEQAAMNIVAEKIGNLRGSFTFDEHPIILNDARIRIVKARKSQSLGGFQRPAYSANAENMEN